MNNPIVAFVVLNYNDYAITSDYIKRINHYSVINHIVIVDNFSTDGSFEKLQPLVSDKVDVIKTFANEGYARGNNYGIRYAIDKYNPDIIAISNPDIEITEHFVESMVNELENSDDRTGLISGIEYHDGDMEATSAWRLPNFIFCNLEQLNVFPRLFKGLQLKYSGDELRTKDRYPVDVVPGCLFFVKTKVFSEVGLFDEDTFLYYEENILARKLKKKGYQNYIYSKYSYIHKESVSINKSFPKWKKKFDIAYDSRKLYCQKYLRINRLQIVLLRTTYLIGILEYKVFYEISAIRNGQIE